MGRHRTELAGLAEEGGIGPLRRVHRRRAPVWSGGANAVMSIAILAAILTPIVGPIVFGATVVGSILLGAAILLGTAAGAWLWAQVAPVGIGRQQRIAVCDGGIVISGESARPEVLRWPQVHLEEPPPTGDPITRVALLHRDGDVETIDEYTGRRELLAALRQHRPVPVPYLRYAATGAAVVAVAALFVWQLVLPRYLTRTEDRLPARVDDLAPACEGPGTAYSAAAPVTGPGPHPIALFQLFDDGSAQRLSTDLPPDAEPDRPDAVRLVGCVTTSEVKPEARTCEYSVSITTAAVSLPLYRIRYRIEVYELRTHRRLGKVSVDSDDTTCPERATVVAGRDNAVFGRHTAAQLEKALTRFVGG
jgi:hypothetical protein